MGWRAGEMAAKRANMQKEFPEEDGERLDALKALCDEMLHEGGGHHWREVELAVQNVMDYYCGDVRTGTLLNRGIERLGHIKTDVSFNATNAHELMRCMEVRSLTENADLIMRTSLERKETRKLPPFVRTDFPEQDDLNWLAFLSVRLQDGKLQFERLPIT
jgi:adenylylsulfate reductase subunit A